jgi:two-component system chemotaxis sensor kinase CheA
MRGSVEIDSEKGIGTTITIKLPLTLAIIDGLLVEVGGEHFVIPLASVEECVELTREDVSKRHGRHFIKVRGQIVPYIRLRDQFRINGNIPEIEQIVITEIDQNRVGFVVDHVIGQHQTVIKNLSKIYKNVEAISGATIMADGNVALILDINRHLHLIEKTCEEQPG